MRKIILLLAVLMSGCVVDDNHGYGYGIDGVTSLGIEYRGSTLSPFQIDDEFKNVYQCITEQWREPLNTDFNGYAFYIDLMVFFVNQVQDTDSEGRFYNDTNLVLVVDQNSPYHNDYSVYVYRHELVHYILSELTNDVNFYHQSSFFYSCVYF